MAVAPGSPRYAGPILLHPAATAASLTSSKPMTCEHLDALDQSISAAGFQETFRGKPWSERCRDWVYYDCVLDAPTIHEHFQLAECVKDHAHLGTHDGHESGFVCEVHLDEVMGLHPSVASRAKRFSPVPAAVNRLERSGTLAA